MFLALGGWKGFRVKVVVICGVFLLMLLE